MGPPGPVSHVDLWIETPTLIEGAESPIPWLQIRHTLESGLTPGAHRFSDVGRREALLLFGHLSISHLGHPEQLHEDEAQLVVKLMGEEDQAPEGSLDPQQLPPAPAAAHC